ncbi:hypothetical protein [Paraburkholderia phytofirmans]|uniref:Uncharacterized protein n=1 Tax=Paraburkholderia phytofirmans OLGA172 TaxID=1417228 RepID=A0A160FT19_9BURK|nr:hypothetical protein [Paraburkholderia phytofirmans]ANB76280.1 hypothetical protein AYM40_28950 [Paraburkholderia phytofirmans OLGA172]
MKVTAFFAVVVLSMSLFTPAFASEHMHVNHDHEHTRYQPPGANQGGSDQNTPVQAPQDNSPGVPGSK